MSFSTLLYAENSGWDMSKENYAGTKEITVYSDPNCGCCSKWVAHLEKHDFDVTDIKTGAIGMIKGKYNVPPALTSCHTAIIDGYVIEGHVPADDIKRLLNSRSDIRGLSVPQMPVGTPGMEMGDRKDHFEVISFTDDSETAVFQKYTDY
jgi:hypothetical protein